MSRLALRHSLVLAEVEERSEPSAAPTDGATQNNHNELWRAPTDLYRLQLI